LLFSSDVDNCWLFPTVSYYLALPINVSPVPGLMRLLRYPLPHFLFLRPSAVLMPSLLARDCYAMSSPGSDVTHGVCRCIHHCSFMFCAYAIVLFAVHILASLHIKAVLCSLSSQLKRRTKNAQRHQLSLSRRR
jgi:hypothetical protein